MHQNKLPDIFTYDDYRVYLSDYRTMRKIWDEGFTHDYICYRLGQKNSKSYFSNVVKGRRDVSSEFINRFIELLELVGPEIGYFRDLVHYNQTTNAKEKEFLLKKINRQSATESKLVTEQEYLFYEEWYHSVIRTMLDVVDFKDNYKALADFIIPRVPVKHVKESIQLLKKLNLVKLDEQGFLRPAHKSIRTPDYVQNRLIRQYQLQCLELAKIACLGNHEIPDDIYTNVISVSETALKEVQQLMINFKKEVRAIVQKDPFPADRIYQLDMQLFPNSRIQNSESMSK